MRDIFWAHPDSIKLLNIFPIVLVMDSTYKTNKYRQPLFEIVGMTSTELTFAVAFAYMESEQTDSFCWVLEKLKELFVQKDLRPKVILTDRDLALMKAVEIVFPTTQNLLCRFHINKNVGMRCKQYVVKEMRETIDTLWEEVVWASDEVEYAQKLEQLEQACFNCADFIDYVKDTWLIPHRHRFVGAWIDRVLHLGNTTTNRYVFYFIVIIIFYIYYALIFLYISNIFIYCLYVFLYIVINIFIYCYIILCINIMLYICYAFIFRVESAHWKLKQMLGNSLGDTVNCWEAMNNNLRIQIGNIRASFQKSFYEVEHAHVSPLYGNLRSFVSRAALRRIAQE